MIAGDVKSGMPFDQTGWAAARKFVIGRASKKLVRDRRTMRDTTIVRFNYELSWDPGSLLGILCMECILFHGL